MLDKKARTMKDLKALSKDLGITLPEVKKSTGEPSRQQMIRLLEYATENGFVIHPMGYQYYVDGFNEFRHCPCDATRPACPCKEANDEVRTKGKCKCQLFWLNYERYVKEKLS